MTIFGLFILGSLLLFGVAGVVLLTLGLRGTPRFSTPHCAKCAYDLRGLDFLATKGHRCPECGSELDTPAAVSFGDFQRRRWWIVGGAVLIVLALLVPVAMMFIAVALFPGAGAGPSAAEGKSTEAIIAGLSVRQSGPWDWRELEQRMTAGAMTQAEVDSAFDVLIQYFIQRHAAGSGSDHLPWAGDFVRQAMAGNFVSDEKKLAFLEAYYGSPDLRLPRAARTGQPVSSRVGMLTHWEIEPLRAVWHLREVRANESAPLEMLHSEYLHSPEVARHPDRFSGTRHDDARVTLSHGLAPGQHELLFVFDLGVVRNQTILRGLDGRPGSPDKWPDPVARWEVTVRRQIQIVGENEPVVLLITDPAQNPLKDEPLAVEEALVRPTSGSGQLVIKWKERKAGTPVLCYDVTVVAGSERIDFGSYVRGSLNRGGFTSITDNVSLPKPLPPEVRSIDLLFTPSPRRAERTIGIDEIWGEPFEITNVPLNRYDLEAPTAGAP